MTEPEAMTETEFQCDIHENETLLHDGDGGFLCEQCDRAYIDSLKEDPTDEFVDYYERSSKKYDLIEIIWHLMTQKQKEEILKDLWDEEESDEEDDDVCQCCKGINSKDCKADCIFYCESCKLYLPIKQRGLYNDDGEKCLACLNQTQE